MPLMRTLVAIGALLAASPAFSQNAKISTLIPVTLPLTGPELFYVVQGGVSKNMTFSQLQQSVSASLVIGSSVITGGTSGNVEFNNGGVLGEKSVTGTGSVVLATSPVLTTPNLGTPSAAVLTNATGLPNAGLLNSSVTIGSTNVVLGATATTLAGLSSVTSTTFVGSLTGHASLDLPLTGGAISGAITYGGVTLANSVTGTGSMVLSASPTFTGIVTTSALTISGITGSTQCVQASSSGVFSGTGAACGSGSGAVNSVVNSDGTLTISPTTGSVIASLNLAHANTWTGLITASGGLVASGAPSISQSWSGASNLVSLNSNVTAASAGSNEVSAIVRMTSALGAGASYKGAFGAEMTMNAGSGQGFAVNAVLTVNTSVGNQQANAFEPDFNNFNKDYPLPNQGGYLGVTGNAIDIAFGSSGSGSFAGSAAVYMGTLDVGPNYSWHAGIYMFGSTLIKDYSIYDGTSSTYGYLDAGVHTDGILSSGTDVNGLVFNGTYSSNVIVGSGFAIGPTGVALFAGLTVSSTLLVDGHILAGPTTPTISACGTGSPAVSGSDTFGKIVAGGGALTSCVVNFGTAFTTAPDCVVSGTSSITGLDVTASATQITIGGTSLTGVTITYHCGSVS